MLVPGAASADKKSTKQPSQPMKKKSKKKKKSKNHRNYDADTKENSQEEIFQRRMKDGSTSLAILTPGEGIVPGTTRDRPISLGSLIGRVKNGTTSLQGFREDKRNIVKPMYALSYGMFASHGPAYDSTFANLTVEESKLVETCDKFLEQGEHKDVIRNVCLGDYTNTFVDHIIDLFDSKEDSMEVTEVTEDTTKASPEDSAVPAEAPPTEIDFDALKSLSEEGIDMSFLPSLQARLAAAATQGQADSSSSAAAAAGDQPAPALSVESRLEATAGLLESLKTVQQERLSLPPPANLNLINLPSDKELELAEQVAESLASIIQVAARPGQVASLPAIRRAMGVTLASPTASPPAAPAAAPPLTAAATTAVAEVVEI